MSAFESALFPAFVEPADRCDRCRVHRKEYRVQLIARNIKTDSCEFLIADLCAGCSVAVRDSMPAAKCLEVVP